MTATVNLFMLRSRFPEFSTVKDANVQAAIEMAKVWVDPKVWSTTDYPDAVIYWAAHWLSLQAQQLASTEAGGADIFVSGIDFGERHVTFSQRSVSKNSGTIGPGEELLSQTIYGQLYLMLRSRNIIPVMIV